MNVPKEGKSLRSGRVVRPLPCVKKKKKTRKYGQKTRFTPRRKKQTVKRSIQAKGNLIFRDAFRNDLLSHGDNNELGKYNQFCTWIRLGGGRIMGAALVSMCNFFFGDVLKLIIKKKCFWLKRKKMEEMEVHAASRVQYVFLSAFRGDRGSCITSTAVRNSSYDAADVIWSFSSGVVLIFCCPSFHA